MFNYLISSRRKGDIAIPPLVYIVIGLATILVFVSILITMSGNGKEAIQIVDPMQFVG